MKKYALAIFSLIDGENKLFIIEAISDVEATIEALYQHCPLEYFNQDYRDWVKSLGQDFITMQKNVTAADLILSEIKEV